MIEKTHSELLTCHQPGRVARVSIFSTTRFAGPFFSAKAFTSASVGSSCEGRIEGEEVGAPLVTRCKTDGEVSPKRPGGA
jgi:hypothetical protein